MLSEAAYKLYGDVWRYLSEIMLKGLRHIFGSQAQFFLNQLLLTSARAIMNGAFTSGSNFLQYFSFLYLMSKYINIWVHRNSSVNNMAQRGHLKITENCTSAGRMV